MENKKLKAERALLLKLREAVNSREEFEWVEAELARCNQMLAEVADGKK